VHGQLISDVAVLSVCFSDHHLDTCRLGVPPPPSPVTTSFTYRALRRIDKQALCRDILQSRLYGSQQSDADEYADLFDGEVTRVLEIHAPLRTGRRRCQMRPWKPSVIVDAQNVDIVALGCRQTSGCSRQRATQRGPAS